MLQFRNSQLTNHLASVRGILDLLDLAARIEFEALELLDALKVFRNCKNCVHVERVLHVVCLHFVFSVNTCLARVYGVVGFVGVCSGSLKLPRILNVHRCVGHIHLHMFGCTPGYMLKGTCCTYGH